MRIILRSRLTTEQVVYVVMAHAFLSTGENI